MRRGRRQLPPNFSESRRVSFTAADLEDNPTVFAVGLEGCGEVLSVDYTDDQGNSPDFSSLPEPTCFEVRARQQTAEKLKKTKLGVIMKETKDREIVRSSPSICRAFI